MIPIDSEFIAWLDDEGHLSKDAPERVKASHQKWLEHEAEWNKLSLQDDEEQEGL